MIENTEVLIIGAGPTGLMMACQLLRFGISFRIIDKNTSRANESRAIGIQARSMEIFQNLGLVDQFLQYSRVAKQILLYINGKFKNKIDFTELKIKDTPFPAIYFLPQADTEKILLEYLEQHQIKVERETELVSFSQSNVGVEAVIQDNAHQQHTINCDYIIGCDGAHSRVRHLLGLKFIGASYEQEFMLADGKIIWPITDDAFIVFFSKKGVFGTIPLWKESCRIITAKINTNKVNNKPLTVPEIESVGIEITKMTITLKDIFWLSRFHLHHRSVEHYFKGRSFLAGDSAHIHTPVGAQGMNTGLQDATNLAWKIAFVLKKISPLDLLATYEIERKKIGDILLKTTDRVFGLVTARGFKGTLMRLFLLPLFVSYMSKFPKVRQRIFLFISQLRIKYYPNHFIQEYSKNADSIFKAGPKAGERAPDAPINNKTLFELFQNSICNLLIFKLKTDTGFMNDIQCLISKYSNIITVHEFIKDEDTQVLFKSYGITSEGIYFIRPDGYIGFRSFNTDTTLLVNFLKTLFLT